MAAFTFRKLNKSVDLGFFLKMQSKLMHTLVEFEAIFMYYKGTFECTVDEDEPKVKYNKAANECPDSLLLEAHLSFLEKKMLQIANTF
jgi:hypothetical protein